MTDIYKEPERPVPRWFKRAVIYFLAGVTGGSIIILGYAMDRLLASQ